MSTHRVRRVADLVREVLADLIRRELRDPRIRDVSVTEVKLSPDLRRGRVWVSSLAGPEARESSVEALNHAAPFLRRALGRSVRLKVVPELTFLADTTVDASRRLEGLLREIREQRPDTAGTDGPNDDDDSR